MTDDIRPCRCGHEVGEHSHFYSTECWRCECQQFEEDGDA